MKTLQQLIGISIIAFLSFTSYYSVAEVDTNEEFLRYTVKKNDTVWAICKAYVKDPLCWKKLVTYNQLVNPKYLPPKSIIRIPKAWLIDHSTTALVIAVEGDVLVVRDGSENEARLIVGDKLNQQDIVKSMQGTAMIQFADDSRLLLKANSSIRMASLQFYDPIQLVNTRVELLKGRVKAQVEKLTNRNSQYQISTPAAVAAVRGTEFRVSRSGDDEKNAVEMRTELLGGALLVSSDINKQEISAGQAVLAVEGKGVSDPVNLLPRPLMVLNENQTIALPLLLDWHDIELAQFYIVSLVSKNSQVWEKSIQKSEILINDINPGQYQLLIRGVDKQGFEGRDRRLAIELFEPVMTNP